MKSYTYKEMLNRMELGEVENILRVANNSFYFNNKIGKIELYRLGVFGSHEFISDGDIADCALNANLHEILSGEIYLTVTKRAFELAEIQISFFDGIPSQNPGRAFYDARENNLYTLAFISDGYAYYMANNDNVIAYEEGVEGCIRNAESELYDAIEKAAYGKAEVIYASEACKEVFEFE